MSRFAGERVDSKGGQRLLARAFYGPQSLLALRYLQGITELAEVRVKAVMGDAHPRRPTLALYLQRSSGALVLGYLRPSDGKLVLRLPWGDVDIEKAGKYVTHVPQRSTFQVSCPLKSEPAIDHAIRLTDQAIRRLQIRTARDRASQLSS